MESSAIALILFGVAFTTLLPWEMHQTARRRRQRTARTTGEIIGVEYRSESSHQDNSFSAGTYHPQVAFEAGGRRREFVGADGVSWRQPRIGTAVSIAYDPRDPSNAAVLRDNQDGSEVLERCVIFGCPIVGIAMIALALYWG
jgi:hypothetical protein